MKLKQEKLKQDLPPSQLKELLVRTCEQIEKSIKRLEKSYQKSLSLPKSPSALTDDQLEIWEGLLSRYSRTVDLFSSKYLRLKLMSEEPGFRGSTRDILNHAEKLGWITSAQRWFELKELRNRQAHDYEDDDLEGLFSAVQQEVPFVLEIQKSIGIKK